jgi:hypothetical protein
MPLDPTIQGLVDNFREAKVAAEEAGLAARAFFLEEIFRKNLVLSSSSLFEHRISKRIEEHVIAYAGGSDCVVAMVKYKALKRQYHTYFNWEKEKLGDFPTLLGDFRGGTLKNEADVSPTKESTSAFLELGLLRNQLVHKNFAAFVCEKDSEELIVLCERAEGFVRRVEELLDHGSSQGDGHTADPPATQ